MDIERMNSNIDFKALLYASQRYSDHSFEPITVPMLCSQNISALTKPANRKDLYHQDLVYVASAEQSFLQLIDDKKLDLSKHYQSLTPCYRDEPNIDEIHFNIFLKLELISFSMDIITMLGIAKKYILN